jgi:hypothetical protein
MKKPIISILATIILIVTGCSLLGKKDDTTKSGATNTPENAAKWKTLPDVLDFYDEVKKINSDFKLEIFSGAGEPATFSGKYEYVRGESKWTYLGPDGKLNRIIECFVDRVVIKVPKTKTKTKRRRRRRRRKPKTKLVVDAEHKAKYPCVIQALVHYSGALNRNRLDHDNKIFLVNKFNDEKKLINKVTLVKGRDTMVYSFSNIEFQLMEGQTFPGSKPEPEVKKVDVKKTVTKKPSDKKVDVKKPSDKKAEVKKDPKVVKPPVKKTTPKEEAGSDDETPPV